MKIRRMTKAQLRKSAENGIAKSARTHGDGRHEHIVAEAHAILDSFCEVPDFEARCEARIQAARAGS
jgi:hypothetical protein